jgi:predicted outer membrane lipoprotein
MQQLVLHSTFSITNLMWYEGATAAVKIIAAMHDEHSTSTVLFSLNATAAPRNIN